MTELSISSLCADGFEDRDFVRSFEMFPRLGYRFVELNMWHPGDLMPPKIRELRRRCDDAGLRVSCVYSSAFGGHPTVDAAHKVRMIEAAQELGCRRICCTGSNRGSGNGIHGIIKVLETIVPTAEEADVLICLENHQANDLETIEDYRIVMAAIDSYHVGICIDTGHFDAAGVDMTALIEELGDRVNHIHLKENDGFGSKRFVKFGAGTTDNAGIVETMKARGYHGYVNIELSPNTVGLEPNGSTDEDLLAPINLYGHLMDRI